MPNSITQTLHVRHGPIPLSKYQVLDIGILYINKYQLTSVKGLLMLKNSMMHNSNISNGAKPCAVI